MLTLSQNKLSDFLACRRRFQLRYIDHLPWPSEPLSGRAQETRELGQRFHEILHRHFLGLSVAEEVAVDQRLRRWWQLFQRKGPTIPFGRLFPEFSLTMPIGRHLLSGRFDLLAISVGRIQIFDWKTDEQRPKKVQLQEALQTRIYLTLAKEAGSTLRQDIKPEQISLVYWYVNDPEENITISYSQDQHIENLSYLRESAAKLDQLLGNGGDWPLTDDLDHCGRCAYQVYCGRIVESLDLNDWGQEDEELSLDPARP